MRLSYAQGTEREKYALTTIETQSHVNVYISIYIQDSIQRGSKPDLAQMGQKTLSTYRDNAGSVMEPLLEARRLPTDRGNLPILQKNNVEITMDGGGGNPSRTWPP